MKKILLYVVLMAAALAMPVERSDVGKLIPVETVFLYIEENECVVETDTENLGRGKNVDEAVRDLCETTSGIIYLDTAEYLLIGEKAEKEIAAIGKYLKPSVRVCKADLGIDLRRASEYLAIHKTKFTLKNAESAEELERIQQSGKQIKMS